jgi:hypothetical protein
MKIKGREIKTPNQVIIAIPRGDGNDIVFKAQAILDHGELEKLCPRPTPPEMLQRGVGKVQNVEDPIYKGELQAWAKRAMAWRIVKSLSATPDLEWETVKLEDATTWENWEKELTEAGFSDYEKQRILNGVSEANGLDEEKIEIARQRFLLGEGATNGSTSSLTVGQNSTQSGEPVNAST